MKSAPYVLFIFLYAGVSCGQGTPARQPIKQPVATNLHKVEVKDLPPFTRFDYERSPRDPFLDKSVTATIIGTYKPSVMDKLVLVSWLNNGGRMVIYVQNTETNEVQKITSEPNKDNLRIVEIHPNPDPKLFEAVISDGSEKGAVKFRMSLPNPSPQPAASSSGAAQTKPPPIETATPRAGQKKN
jgi:hypothetical protein